MADGVDQILDQIKMMRTGLDQAAAFLLTMAENAGSPATAGFNIPPEILALEDFKAATKAYVSPDGHSARYLVFTKLDPFGPAAMDQVGAIEDAARGALPNTELSDASVSMGGYPVALADTRDYYENDIRFIVIVTIIVVLLILMALLRAVIAPLYLVGSVVHFVLRRARPGCGRCSRSSSTSSCTGRCRHLGLRGARSPSAPTTTCCFVSRMRDEAPHGRFGIIRTLCSSTGGVITAAGLIFAASMWGLLFSSIGTVVQGGFVIGIGILLDTFLVRTVTVPAMATLGRKGELVAVPTQQRGGAVEHEEKLPRSDRNRLP